ncbi:MAG: hypothetical protein JJE04_21635 [Acidobacteriia bacterium]|nr:hypothetical protein [Terriglobia bacterium]
MATSDLYDLSLPELAAHAVVCLGGKDLPALGDVDLVLHQLFFEEAKVGSEESRTELIGTLLSIVESGEARAIGRPEAVQGFVTEWAHLIQLAAGFRADVDELTEAKRIVASRWRGESLVQAAAGAGAMGIQLQELAEELGITPQNLSPLVAYFESHDIVVRRRQGQRVFVTLGKAGLLLEQPKEAERRPRRRRVAGFPQEARCRIALPSPRGFLSATA